MKNEARGPGPSL